MLEYLQKLELFLGGEFDIDYRGKSISFAFSDKVLSQKALVYIDDVIEEHSSEINVDEDDQKCEYSETKNLAYKDVNHQMSKFYSCDWFIRNWSKHSIWKYNTLQELVSASAHLMERWTTAVNNPLLNDNSSMKDLNYIMYAADVDGYYLMRPYDRTYLKESNAEFGRFYRFCYSSFLQPINMFGPRIVNDSDNADTVEIDFVPVCVDFTDKDNGLCMFLDFSGYDEDYTVSEDAEDYPMIVPTTIQTLNMGEQDQKAEYYSQIYIGWFEGASDLFGKLPHPVVNSVDVHQDTLEIKRYDFSMRLNDRSHGFGKIKYDIEPSMNYTFKFLSDSLPDVRSLFIIRGKRYICEKLTATFTTEAGMSQLIKGVFWPLKDSPDSQV